MLPIHSSAKLRLYHQFDFVMRSQVLMEALMPQQGSNNCFLNYLPTLTFPDPAVDSTSMDSKPAEPGGVLCTQQKQA